MIEVLATGGDMTLGGDDWDNAVVDWLLQEHLKPLGVEVSRPAMRARLRAVAEAAKVCCAAGCMLGCMLGCEWIPSTWQVDSKQVVEKETMYYKGVDDDDVWAGEYKRGGCCLAVVVVLVRSPWLPQRRLSSKKEVTVQIPLGKGRPAAEAVLTAAKLDALTTPLYQRARFPIEEACFQVCHAFVPQCAPQHAADSSAVDCDCVVDLLTTGWH